MFQVRVHPTTHRARLPYSGMHLIPLHTHIPILLVASRASLSKEQSRRLGACRAAAMTLLNSSAHVNGSRTGIDRTVSYFGLHHARPQLLKPSRVPLVTFGAADLRNAMDWPRWSVRQHPNFEANHRRKISILTAPSPPTFPFPFFSLLLLSDKHRLT